jgi:pentatricopeptide repeat protein
MKLRGYTPDKVTWNVLLDVFSKSHKHEEVGILVDMEACGVSLTLLTYNSLISSYAKDGMLPEAIELKEQMQLKRIKPDVVTYTTLISGFQKAAKDRLAHEMFEEMISNGQCYFERRIYNIESRNHLYQFIFSN